MLGAGMVWLTVAVAADLGALAASQRVVDLDGRVARLVPAVVAGFALQTLTGALTYLLPVVFGRGAQNTGHASGRERHAWSPGAARKLQRPTHGSALHAAPDTRPVFWGNRRLGGILELGWRLRVAAVNPGVLALVAVPGAGWVAAVTLRLSQPGRRRGPRRRRRGARR